MGGTRHGRGDGVNTTSQQQVSGAIVTVSETGQLEITRTEKGDVPKRQWREGKGFGRIRHKPRTRRGQAENDKCDELEAARAGRGRLADLTCMQHVSL